MDLRDALQQSLGDQYAVEQELGGGGMSRVFLAHDRALDRRIVVKVLAPDLAAGVNRERFAREVLLAAQLQHPNIVTVLGTGLALDLPYYTMPFIDGQSLRTRLAGGPLPVPETVSILRDTARALAFAHARGVVHRDIKPDNVLVTGGAAMVTDFGVAKALSSGREAAPGPVDSGAPLTTLGTSLGTLGYMAPEQAAADPAVDHRADLYSFGATAYEMLAGKAPFAGLPPRELLTALLARDPAPLDSLVPDLPPALVALIHRCLAKAPEERPASAEGIMQTLERVFTAPGAAAAIRSAAGRRWRLATGVLGVLLLAGAAWWIGHSHQAAPAAVPNSLVVFPFSVTGGDSQDAYFADGIADELTTVLSRVPTLRVASSAAAFALRDRAADLRTVAGELGVANALTGSVRRGGNRVRVTAQLASARDGLVRWADSYDFEVRDVFQVQEEIARAIAGALEVAFEPHRLQAGPGTGDVAAYDLYLKGRFYWRQRGEAALRTAADYFSQAIALDSGFARAWAGHADALGLLPVYGPTPVDSVLPLVERDAARALALDSTLAEAHVARGGLYKSLGRWPEAERSLRRAIAADSTVATAFQWLGELYGVLGRTGEAVNAMRRARAIEPTSPIINGELGYTLALAGEADSAVAVGRRAIALAPELWTGHAFLGSSLLWLNRPEAAVPELEQAMRLAPRNPFGGALAYALAAVGQRERAGAMVQALAAKAERGEASPTTVAIGLVGLGDRSGALHWLERASRARDGMLYAVPLDSPWFAPLWDDPRFTRLREAMGLAHLPSPR